MCKMCEMCNLWKMYKKFQHCAKCVKSPKAGFRDASASQKCHHCTLDKLARLTVIWICVPTKEKDSDTV